MNQFELSEPTTVEEALALLDSDDPLVRPFGGFTALMQMIKAGVFKPERLVSLRKIESLRKISKAADGSLVVGALVPLAVMENSPEVAAHLPMIPSMMKRLSNVRVRNVATVGGALAHGDPHMDLPPTLMALGATIQVKSKSSERVIKVEDLFAGYYETILERNEIITEARIPPQGDARSAYLKFTSGSQEDWPAVGIAACVEAEGDTVKSARLVVTAATEKAMRLPGAESVLTGGKLDAATLKKAGDAAADEAETIADSRGSAAYKRELLRVLLGRCINKAISKGSSIGATH